VFAKQLPGLVGGVDGQFEIGHGGEAAPPMTNDKC
jgi:hypothetical protein